LVLDRVSLQIPRGKTVALVGRSGGGKSTVCGLVSALYEELQSGRVLVNGRDLRGIDKRSYHGLLGVVMQDTELFNATIESNVAFGARGACTHEEVVAACKQANAHDFVSALEEGYQTKVGERGLKLSGGQRQRLALARVLIRKPQLLILDETTSALDAESEAVVQQSIDALLAQGNVTVLLVAHRLSTVMNADKICVVENGRVVEEGSHAQLLARRGVYWRLVSRQVQKLANTLELEAHDPREMLKRSAGCEATIDALLDEN
jgi:ABC-type multidrug transport system fused ATPase/permease subunit